MTEERAGRGGSVVGAVLLILVGVLFLLNNFGVLSWDVWSILWRFWPIVFILWGLQAIFGRSPLARAVIGIFGVLLILSITLLAVSASSSAVNSWIKNYLPNWNSERFITVGEPTTTTQIITESDYSTLSERSIRVDVGMGKLTLTDEQISDYLALEGKYYRSLGEPTLKHSADNGVLKAELTTRGGSVGWIAPANRLEYRLRLGMPELLTDFGIKLGAGSAEVLLDTLRTKMIRFEVGAGSARLELSAASVPTNGAEINVGTGAVTVRLPKSVGLQVRHNVGLGELELDGRKVKGDGTFTSDNYEAAVVRLELRADVGAGSIKIERY